MENRKLHELLVSESISRSSIEEAANQLAKKITNHLEWNLSSSTIYKNDFLVISFDLNSDEKASMKIQPDFISFNFGTKIYSDAISFDLDRSVKAIKNRYYPNFFTTTSADLSHFITADYKISRKQLSTKDFIEYASFMIDKALRLGRAIQNANQRIAKDIAA